MREDDRLDRGFSLGKGEEGFPGTPLFAPGVIEDALRAAFAKGRKTSCERAEQPLKTYKGSGLHPGIDLTSSSALHDAMESR